MTQKRKHANHGGQPLLMSRAAVPAENHSSGRQNEARSFEDDIRVARAMKSRRESLSVGSEASSEHSTKVRKKAEPVKSACVQCQKRKTKCSGERPICRFCSDRDLTCSWDISDGMTRTADLKQKLVDATGRSEILTQQLSDEEAVSIALQVRLDCATDRGDNLDVLMDVLRFGTDQVSTMLLAKLRMGASVEELVASSRADAAAQSSDQSLSSSHASRYAPRIASDASSVADCARVDSRTRSSSPATLPSAAASPQILAFSQPRKGSHRPSQSWKSSPMEYYAPSQASSSTSLCDDRSQYAKSRNGSIAMNNDTANSPVTRSFSANNCGMWPSNLFPSYPSTAQHGTQPHIPPGISATSRSTEVVHSISETA